MAALLTPRQAAYLRGYYAGKRGEPKVCPYDERLRPVWLAWSLGWENGANDA